MLTNNPIVFFVPIPSQTLKDKNENDTLDQSSNFCQTCNESHWKLLLFSKVIWIDVILPSAISSHQHPTMPLWI